MAGGELHVKFYGHFRERAWDFVKVYGFFVKVHGNFVKVGGGFAKVQGFWAMGDSANLRETQTITTNIPCSADGAGRGADCA